MPKNRTVPRCRFFDISTSAPCNLWDTQDWTPLCKSTGPSAFETKFKTLWCEKGIYFLIFSADDHFKPSRLNDFDDLYNEDVVEVFLHPDTDQRLYLEFEVSPFNKELTLLVPQSSSGKFKGWLPWHYEGERKIIHTIHKDGGSTDWQAEIFIPFTLMMGLNNVPPVQNTTWQANICRIKYTANNEHTYWSWQPMTSNTFHNLSDFGTLIF